MIVRSPRPLLRRASLLVGTAGVVWAVAPSPAVAGMSCTTAVTALNYGTFSSPNASPIDTTAALSISCSGANAGSAFRLCISMANPSIPLTSGGNSLAENIYKDASRSTIFGSFRTSATGGVQVDVVANSSGSGSTSVTLYGRVPVQSVPPGSYAVTMAATNLEVGFDDDTSRSCSVIATGGGDGLVNRALTAVATVQAACNVSATNMDFPSVSSLSTAQTTTSTVSLTCSTGLPYNIVLNGGNANATDPTQRKMTSGAQQITYGLYRDSAHTLPWGLTLGTNTKSGTGTGSSQSHTVHGRVPAQTTPAPGTYSDTVVVTVEY